MMATRSWSPSGPTEVDLLAVDRRRDGGLGEPLADRRRHVRGGRAGGVLTLGTVGEGDRDQVAHSSPESTRAPRTRFCPLNRRPIRARSVKDDGQQGSAGAQEDLLGDGRQQRAVGGADRAERQAAAAAGGDGDAAPTAATG